MKHIVKRAGHNELFDGKKLYASIFSACQTLREPVGSSELIADRVTKDVEIWLDKKHEVTSNDIRHTAAKHLSAYHADAAYMYLHHRVIW